VTDHIAFFDIAGTLITGNPWRTFMAHPGIEPNRRRLALARALPLWISAKLGLIDDGVFRDRWIRSMAAVFRGWERQVLEMLVKDVARMHLDDHIQSEIVSRLQQHRTKGDHIVLVSGLFQEWSAAFASLLGAHVGLGSNLDYNADICSGEIIGQTCVGSRKLDFIKAYLGTNQFPFGLSACYAYSDSFSDQPMLAAVGNPVAVFPDSDLRAVAERSGWPIIAGSEQG
jgi:HAD superfamily hydrolase (TIGR01490 family)